MNTYVATTGRKRLIEIFSAGCSVCEDAVKLVQQVACDSCEIQVLDMSKAVVTERAKGLGIRSVPAIVVTSTKLAECCAKGAGPDEATLRAAGVGEPLSEGVRKRVVEIFSAGCAVCEEAISLVNKISCDSCEVRVLDMNQKEISDLARQLGVRRVPAVAVTSSRFAQCCAGRGPEATALQAAGIGQPI